MSYSHAITQSWSGPGLSIQRSNTYTGDGQEGRTIAVAADATDYLVAFALDVSQIQSIYIVSDQAMTIETNDSGSPADTFALVANVPYIWFTGSYFTNLLTTDITALYLTNDTSTAATVRIECVFDSTVA